jgi:hypothetical protein
MMIELSRVTRVTSGRGVNAPLRIACGLLAACFLLAIDSGDAAGALWLTVEPDHGAAGDTVRVRTIGDGAMGAGSPGDSLPLFVTGLSQQTFVETDLTRVGTLTVDASHNGVGSFVVPSVRSGRYQLVLRCDACAPTSAGRTLVPVGEFTVTASVPTTDTIQPDPVSLLPALLVSMGFGLTIVFIRAIAKRTNG